MRDTLQPGLRGGHKMKRWGFSLAAACAFSGAVVAASPAAPVRAEVDALLARLQSSGCQFNRNGTWHGSADAKEHLLRKLAYLEDKGTLQSTEQFIELAASRSSISGRAYQVRCNAEPPVASQVWLTQQLMTLRGAGSAAR